MEGAAIFHDSHFHPSAAIAPTGGQKAKRGKMLKGDSVSVGAAQKKILTDITNTKQNPAPPVAPPSTDVSTDMLLNEIAMMRKLVAHRNVVIESCKAELQKYKINFQNLRKQNSELALANTQMMAEVNSSRQMMRELQLELGSKNGIIKAMKLQSMEKEHTEKLKCDISRDESKQLDQKFQEDNRGEAKRKRVSKSRSCAPAVVKQGSKVNDVAIQDPESSGPTNTEQVIAKKNVEKRQSLRRQSALFRPENSEPVEDFFDVDDPKFEASTLCDDVSESLPTASSATSEDNASTLDPHKIRRSSIGRPLRRSAVKVVSYKEIPLNVKMRREN